MTNGTEAVSQAISVAGANSVGIDMTIINQDSGNLDVVLEGSNELANWKTIQDNLIAAASGIGYNTAQYPNATSGLTARIGFEYIRLRYVQNTSGTSIVSAGINIFEA